MIRNRVAGKRGTLESPFTYREAMEALVGLAEGKPDSFAAKLVADFTSKGQLSSEQWWWVHKLAMDAAKSTPISVGEVAKIYELFAVAAKALKRPKVRLQATTPSGEVVDFRILPNTSASKHPQSLSVVSSGSYEDRTWFGRIDPDGRLVEGKSMTPAIREVVLRFAANPVQVAAEYGKLLGACCFCSRTLEEEGSVEVGYGPVCAEHYGLPHPQHGGAVAVEVPAIDLSDPLPLAPTEAEIQQEVQNVLNSYPVYERAPDRVEIRHQVVAKLNVDGPSSGTDAPRGRAAKPAIQCAPTPKPTKKSRRHPMRYEGHIAPELLMGCSLSGRALDQFFAEAAS